MLDPQRGAQCLRMGGHQHNFICITKTIHIIHFWKPGYLRSLPKWVLEFLVMIRMIWKVKNVKKICNLKDFWF